MKKQRLPILVLVACILCTLVSIGQLPQKKNEYVPFIFNTTDGVTICIAKDTAEKYIVFRMSKFGKEILNFPDTLNESSFSKFSFSSRTEDGDAGDYLFFEAKGTEYVIYQVKTAQGIVDFGITSKEISNGKYTKMQGKLKTKQGNLSFFRTDKAIPKSDRKFE